MTSKSSRHTSRLYVRLTQEQRAQLEADAAKEGTNISDLVRARALRQPVSGLRAAMIKASTPEKYQSMDPVLFAQLSRLGNNLNQITRAFNSGLDVDRAEAVRTVAQIWSTMLEDEVTARYATIAETKVRAQKQAR